MEFGRAGFKQTETCPEQFCKRKLKLQVLLNPGRKLLLLCTFFQKRSRTLQKGRILKYRTQVRFQQVAKALVISMVSKKKQNSEL